MKAANERLLGSIPLGEFILVFSPLLNGVRRERHVVNKLSVARLNRQRISII